MKKGQRDRGATQRQLQALADEAYTRELGTELARLEADFSQWRSGEISPFELSDRIHRFHDGVSRQLYVLYTSDKPRQSVARAVALQILQEEEVASELWADLESAIQFFRESQPEE